MDIALIYFVKDLLLPPTGNVLLALLAYTLRHRMPRFSSSAMIIAVASILIVMVPKISVLIAEPLEKTPPFNVAAGAQGAEAIVVLSGGVYSRAPEYRGADTVNKRTLERLRYGAYLHDHLDLPIALVGGDVFGTGATEGWLMYEVMSKAFKTSVTWIEAGSRNTAENASDTRKLVAAKRIILVTNAMHMPRSRRMFEQAGFEVLPAPMGFYIKPDIGVSSPLEYVPALEGLELTRAALHEYLGMLWYRLRYRAS